MSGNLDPWPADYGANNKAFTREAALKARDKLRAILSQDGPVMFTGNRAHIVDLCDILDEEQVPKVVTAENETRPANISSKRDHGNDCQED